MIKVEISALRVNHFVAEVFLFLVICSYIFRLITNKHLTYSIICLTKHPTLNILPNLFIFCSVFYMPEYVHMRVLAAVVYFRRLKVELLTQFSASN